MKHRCTLPVQYAQRKEATPRFFCSLQNNPLYFDSSHRSGKSRLHDISSGNADVRGQEDRVGETGARRIPRTASGFEPELLRECTAAQGYSPQDAERLALEREEEALAYANRQFQAA